MTLPCNCHCHPGIRRPVVQEPSSLEPHEPLDERRPFLVLPRLLVRLARPHEWRIRSRDQPNGIASIEQRLPRRVRPRRDTRVAITSAVPCVIQKHDAAFREYRGCASLDQPRVEVAWAGREDLERPPIVALDR